MKRERKSETRRSSPSVPALRGRSVPQTGMWIETTQGRRWHIWRRTGQPVLKMDWESLEDCALSPAVSLYAGMSRDECAGWKQWGQRHIWSTRQRMCLFCSTAGALRSSEGQNDPAAGTKPFHANLMKYLLCRMKAGVFERHHICFTRSYRWGIQRFDYFNILGETRARSRREAILECVPVLGRIIRLAPLLPRKMERFAKPSQIGVPPAVRGPTMMTTPWGGGYVFDGAGHPHKYH